MLLAFSALEVGVRQLGHRANARSVIEQHQSNFRSGGSSDAWGIVFVGDSSTGAAFDADDIAQRLADTGGTAAISTDGASPAYNLWLPGASPLVLGPLVDEFLLADDATADQVVLGVTARMFNTSRVESRRLLLDEMRSSLPWRSRAGGDSWWSRRMIAAEQAAADRLGLVRYRAGLRRPTDWLVGARNSVTLTLAEDGQANFFAPLSTAAIRDGYESGERAALSDYSVADDEVLELLALVARLELDGTTVTVVLLPTFGPIYDRFFPEDTDNADAVDRLRRELADEAITVVDLTGLGDDETLFADGNHLNERGSEAVTAALTEALRPGR
jgi:hypothetical protein